MKRIETVSEYCPQDCIYRAKYPVANGSCIYILIEGHSRGCPVSKCNKYISRKDKSVTHKMNAIYDFVAYVVDNEENND